MKPKGTRKDERRKIEEKRRLRARYEALQDIYDDLPDGAYFAAMEENGFDTDTIVWLHQND